MSNNRLERFFWNQYAGSYDRLSKHYVPYQSLVKEVCDHIDWYAKGQPLKVLDAGCGTGNYTVELARRGHDVVGIDASTAMLERAKQKSVQKINQPPKILTHDLERPLPFNDKSFDAVVSVHVLYVLSDQKQFLKELRRISRNSSVIVVVNSSSPLKARTAIGIQWRLAKGVKRLSSIASLLSVGFWNLLISLRERNGTYKLTSADELKQLLIDAGAVHVEIYETYVGSVMAIGWWKSAAINHSSSQP